MRRMIRRGAAAALVAAAAAVAGCGGPREERLPETGATLEGTITYGGEAVHFAQVQVMGGGKSAIGRVGEDGRYRVENVPLGEVTVGVNTAAATGEYRSKAMQSGVNKGPEGKGKPTAPLPRFVELDKKYFDPATSGFKTTVQPGANTYDVKVPR